MKMYRKKGLQPMRPYVEGEDMSLVSVSVPDKNLPTLEGGMIATSRVDPDDMWYVNKEFFKANYEEV